MGHLKRTEPNAFSADELADWLLTASTFDGEELEKAIELLQSLKYPDRSTFLRISRLRIRLQPAPVT